MSHCRLCESHNVEPAFDFGHQPVVHHLLDDSAAAFETFPFTIVYCPHCGFLQMPSYPAPEILYQNYITVSSWKPQPHAEKFFANIVRLFGLLPEHRILEIGCNDGGFLELMRSSGYHNFLGVEPTHDASRMAIEKGLPVVRSFYGTDTLDDHRALFPEPNLIVSRQVIEHIPDLNGVLSAARAHLAPGGGLALEFPDHTMNFEALDYSFWEEHVNYFTIHTIRQLLAKHGFEIFHHESTLFSGKCLFVYARRLDSVVAPSFLAQEDTLARRYIRLFPSFVAELHRFLEARRREGGMVMFGCGSRSSNFINLTGSASFFDRFVDDQAQKQGKFAPGSRLRVTSSEDLDPSAPVALGVNSENEFHVIRNKNLERSFSVLPPSSLLPGFWKSMALSNTQ
jgi:SAM-dependent methyltransferase